MSVFRTDIYGFTFHQFQSDIIQKQIAEVMGATINQITNKDMLGFKIPLPENTEEQAAIAAILRYGQGNPDPATASGQNPPA